MAEDFLPINGTDHIEFYVGNAKQSALYYQYAFGFELVAYSGPETGNRDKVSYVLKQDKIRLVLSSGLHPDSPISEHVKKHGDGVKVLALWVDDAEKSYHETMSRGAVSYFEPMKVEDEHGEIVMSAIRTYGETIHTFVERSNYSGPFLPGFVERRSQIKVEPIGLKYVDHCVGNVELGKMNDWVEFYENVMGFSLLLTFDDKDISTEYSALMSKVVSNGNGYIKFPINQNILLLELQKLFIDFANTIQDIIIVVVRNVEKFDTSSSQFANRLNNVICCYRNVLDSCSVVEIQVFLYLRFSLSICRLIDWELDISITVRYYL